MHPAERAMPTGTASNPIAARLKFLSLPFQTSGTEQSAGLVTKQALMGYSSACVLEVECKMTPPASGPASASMNSSEARRLVPGRLITSTHCFAVIKQRRRTALRLFAASE